MAADQERADRIRALKQARPDLTWRRIADHVGVTERSATDWQTKGGIDYANAVKLAELFEVDVDYVWRGPVEADRAPSPFAGQDALVDRFDALEERVTAALDQFTQAIDKQNDLLERQSEAIDRIEGLLGRDTETADATRDVAEGARKLVRQIEADYRSGKLPKRPPASKPAARATAPKANQGS